MTKQEILDKYVPCSCWTANDGGRPVYNSSCHQHSPDPESAMDEWAKERSIAFAEWIRYSGVFNDTHKKWEYGSGIYTTEELYDLFIQSI